MEKIDKRANILEAAERLFTELGYEGTSTRQIAKESGANMSMIKRRRIYGNHVTKDY